MPWFEVLDLEGRRWTTSSLPSETPALVAFLCNHSPYVVHIESSFAEVAERLNHAGVFVIGIASNDERAYPADARDRLLEQARRAHWGFPYGFDESQRAAKAFGASCTPEFFLYDGDRRLVYHGQYDSSRPATGSLDSVTGEDLLSAVDAVMQGEPPPRRQLAAFGCSIKWRAGNEPSYIYTEMTPHTTTELDA